METMKSPPASDDSQRTRVGKQVYELNLDDPQVTLKNFQAASGKTDDNGKKLPFELKKGDRVLVNQYGGTEIKLNGKDYKIVNSDDVLAVIE